MNRALAEHRLFAAEAACLIARWKAEDDLAAAAEQRSRDAREAELDAAWAAFLATPEGVAWYGPQTRR